MAKILIAEDDDTVMFGLIQTLEAASHTIECVVSGNEAADRLRLYSYDLAILDWGLPELSGIDICKQYRDSGGTMPILVLTGRSKDADKMEGLDSGADDYLTKPFSIGELQARVRALLRRSSNFVSNSLSAGNVTLDTSRCIVKKGDSEIALLAKEYALLEFLLRNKGQIFDVTALLNHVWSSESDASEDAVRQCMMRLRKKIDEPNKDSLIKTVKGLGYVLEEPG